MSAASAELGGFRLDARGASPTRPAETGPEWYACGGVGLETDHSSARCPDNSETRKGEKRNPNPPMGLYTTVLLPRRKSGFVSEDRSDRLGDLTAEGRA